MMMSFTPNPSPNRDNEYSDFEIGLTLLHKSSVFKFTAKGLARVGLSVLCHHFLEARSKRRENAINTADNYKALFSLTLLLKRDLKYNTTGNVI
jgi:hypothetical protein